MAVCRELTKKFEDVQSGPVESLRAFYAETPARGEIVVLIGAGDEAKVDKGDLEAALVHAMLNLRVKDAADAVAGAYGLPRRDIYQLALKLQCHKNRILMRCFIKLRKGPPIIWPDWPLNIQ